MYTSAKSAIFREAKLDHSNLTQIHAELADFSEASLIGVNFALRESFQRKWPQSSVP